MKLVKEINTKVLKTNNVSDQEAEEAFKTILTWMGEDPSREGLLETPKRVLNASSASLSETFLVSKILLSVSSTNFIRQVYTVNRCF